MSRFHQAVTLGRDRPPAVAPVETASVPADVRPAPLPAAVVVAPEFEREATVFSADFFDDIAPPGPAEPPAPPPLPAREEAAAPWPDDVVIGRAMGETLVTHPESNPLLVDQFRKLAATLHQAQLEHGTRTVTIASTFSSEGKTLTAVNLALTLARSYGRRVLLVDGDLRGPSIHTCLDCPLAPGLTDLIASSPDAEPPVVDLMPRLSVLTAGTMTRDPISALSSERFRAFLTAAAEGVDWIVIDMPPVGALPDAALLTTLSDTTILVVQAGAAAYQLVQRAAETIGPDRILGVVLNMVPDGEIGATYGNTTDYLRVVAPAT